MEFETCKYLGGIGAILMFIGIIPYTFGLLEIVGAILVVIATKGFADYYKEAGIFNNTLYSVIMAVVGFGAFAVIAFLALLDFLTNIGISLNSNNFANWESQISSINFSTVPTSTLLRFIGFVLVDIVVLFVFMIVAAMLLRKSLKILAEKTRVNLFNTTGTVFLVGAVLVIVFGLGLILVWISVLMLAIAFFQIKLPQPQMASPPPAPQTIPPPPPGM